MTPPINYPSPSSSSSSSSSGLYIPVHRRVPRTGTSPSMSSQSSSSSCSSPTHSLRSLSPMLDHHHRDHHHHRDLSLPIYTLENLLFLASSPLSKFSHEDLNVLRSVAPEVVQTRKRRKALEWYRRNCLSSSSSYSSSPYSSTHTHKHTHAQPHSYSHSHSRSNSDSTSNTESSSSSSSSSEEEEEGGDLEERFWRK